MQRALSEQEPQHLHPSLPCAAQFFALADVFLSSPLVPAYTMASFAKRLGRLALAAPPAGAMIAIAFIHNLMR